MFRTLLLAIIIIASLANAYVPYSHQKGVIRHFADSPAEAERLAPLEPLELPGYDVIRYDLAITFYYPEARITGDAGIIVQVLTDADSIMAFNIGAALVCDSVWFDSVTTDFSISSDTVYINLHTFPAEGETIRFDVFYHGNPTSGYYSAANNHGNTIGFTHAEPIDARDWFPCNDAPYDKALLILYATIPSGLDILSNGVCEDTIVSGDWTTFIWTSNQTIATYLVSVAIGDYAIIRPDYLPVPLYWYVYPEDSAVAEETWAYVLDAMTVYSELFAPYPFDKYSMSQIPLGWMAMENQTCTSMGQMFALYDYWLVAAHELSHHWWGDCVTCGTWKDIWLNESFASLCEPLYLEQVSSYDEFRDYVHAQQEGYLYSDEFNEFPIYDPDYMWGATIYPKGSAVLDMLRFQMGDSLFFLTLRTYFSRFMYNSAITTDFISVCEEFYGDSLDWFFDQWIYSAHTPTIIPLCLNNQDGDSTGYKVIIHQDEPVYRLKAQIAAIDDSTEYFVTQNVLSNDWEMNVTALAGTHVEFDPDHRVLFMPDNKSIPQPKQPIVVNGNDVAVSWETPPAWANIASCDVRRFSIWDSVTQYVAETADTELLDIDVSPGYYIYELSGRWSVDTSFSTAWVNSNAVAVPETGILVNPDSSRNNTLSDSGDYEIYYFPCDKDTTAFKAFFLYHTGDVAIYSRAGSVPVVESDTVTNYDFLSSSYIGEPVQVIYSNISVPAIEQWEIYYFVVMALEPAVTYLFKISYLEMGVREEEFKGLPQAFDIFAYPNPFNSSCEIGIDVEARLPRPYATQIEIFDLNGKLINSLTLSPSPDEREREEKSFSHSMGEGVPTESGRMREYVWTPAPSISSGIYLVRATAQDGQTVTKRIVYLK